MTILRAQVALESDSGLPEDRVVNTWHFLSDELDTTLDIELINTQLKLFYENIDNRLGQQLSGEWRVRFYDLGDPEPRTPVADFLNPVLTPAANCLPAEVAVCLSYHAAPVSGTSQARRRGRLFIGPLSTSWLGASVSPDVRPDGTNINQLKGAAATMLAASNAAATWAWVIYSPTDNLARGIVGGYVDNAFDTQRRRGGSPTIRTVFP